MRINGSHASRRSVMLVCGTTLHSVVRRSQQRDSRSAVRPRMLLRSWGREKFPNEPVVRLYDVPTGFRARQRRPCPPVRRTPVCARPLLSPHTCLRLTMFILQCSFCNLQSAFRFSLRYLVPSLISSQVPVLPEVTMSGRPSAFMSATRICIPVPGPVPGALIVWRANCRAMPFQVE